ncbi:MAG: isopenicillin N synthase family dioxygenase [Janthinobacterium lividum]
MLQAVPIIGIAPFSGTDVAAARQVVDTVAHACRTLGFFLVTGHGVDPLMVRNLYDQARSFFDLPAAAKLVASPADSRAGGLGFMELGRESLAGTAGTVAPGDYKQSLNYGPLLPGGAWPAQPLGLQDAFVAYFAAMEALAARLRGIFCNAIGLPHDHFESEFNGHLSALRVIDYPEPQSPLLPNQLRAGAHTDYGFLTILRSEASSGGLQVQRRDGVWIDVPALDDAFVINIGDAFMRWTNDVWVSTPHRVANPPDDAHTGSRRQSIPFFSNPRSDTVIRCLDQFCDAHQPARYDPVTYGDYIALKTAQANA